MAKTKSQDIPIHRPRTEERNALAAEDADEQDQLRNEILNLPDFKKDKKNRRPDDDNTVIDETGLTGTPLPETTPEPAPPGTKPAPKPKESKVPVAVTSPTFESPLSDEELETELQNFKPRNKHEQAGYPGLHNVIKKVNAMARSLQEQLSERDTKLKELEGKVLPEEEVTRLRSHEDIVSKLAVRALPRWRQYDSEISDSLTKATNILLGLAGGDEAQKAKRESALKVIAKRGGLVALNGKTSFIDSNEPSGITDETTGKVLTNAEFFKKHFYNQLPGHKQREFDLLISRAEEKAREKEAKLIEAESNAKVAVQKDQEEFQANWAKEAAAITKEFLPTVLSKVGLPIARPEIPKDGTAEEKKEATELQKEWDAADKMIVTKSHPSYRFTATGKDIVTGTIKEVLFDSLLPRFEKALARVKELEEANSEHESKMEELKNLRRTNRLESTSAPVASKTDYLEMSDEEALAKAGWKK